jgi:hypothetical protein
MSDKRLVLVVGVGRSGTSLLTGILAQLGFHVPQPEVEADDTNPRGFSEPRWAVDFHTKLLQKQRVTVNDSRPAAFEKTGAAADDDVVRADLRAWLESQLAEADAVVVKDPRTGWFLPAWTRCATDLGLEPGFVTMLRHPAEVIASARKSYGTWQPPASRAAAWINMTLETEHATRGGRRAFVRYEDLMDDWRRETGRVGGLLDVPSLVSPTEEQAAAVDAFVDPTLHRNRVSWDEYDIPASMRDMAEQVWQELQPLADPQGDTPELHAKLDEARAAYAKLYGEAEAIAHSTIAAAKPRKGKKPKPPPPLRARLARRVRSLRRS